MMAGQVNLLLAFLPPLLAAFMLPGVFASKDTTYGLMLLAYGLAYVAFVVLLDLFARYRKAHDVVTTRESMLIDANRAIAEREARYRTLVDLVPVMIRQEDWTAARDMIRQLQAQGVTDLAAHFRASPESLAQMVGLVALDDVNLQGMEMWAAPDLADFRARHRQCLEAPAVQALYARALADFAAGQPSLQAAEVTYDVAGRQYQSVLKLAVPDIAAPDARLVATEMDLTEVKRSDRLLSVFARATSDVIYNWNMQTGRIWWSGGLKRRFGHEPDDFAARRVVWDQLIHPEDRDRVVQNWEAAKKGTSGVWQCAYRFARANGTYAHVRDTSFIERDAEGTVVEIIGSMDDITNEVALQEKFLQSQKLEAIGRVTGGIAHDFNNLLTIVIGNAEILEERLEQDKGGRVLAERTRIAAERAAELTSRLLSFGRRQRLQPVATDVAALLRRIAPLAARTLGDAGVLDLRESVGVPPAMVDPGQLESAILNICRNAGDAMPGGGTLTVTLAVADRADLTDEMAASGSAYVKLTLADTGTGMDPQTAERAFEPFFTTKDNAKASGLGLSMVYGFARQSMGMVRIASEQGAGSTVTLILPVAKPA
jgi:PAS domain S-box-containing protein